MRAWMENIIKRLSTAEDDLTCTKSRAAAIAVWSSQVVPQADVHLLQTKLNKLKEQTALAASANAAEAAAAATEQQRVVERLSQMLTVQQEECADLHARLLVYLIGRNDILVVKS